MIPPDKQVQFERLLQRTKDAVLVQLTTIKQPSSLSGDAFEKIVFDQAERAAIGTEFEGTLEHTANKDFPDILVDEVFGIEVKATKSNHWYSTGNSVLESSRIKTVEYISMFFGKLGGNPAIEFRNYEECLSDIVATHHPRYKINMHLDEAGSIFNKMKTDYDTIRTSDNRIATIRTYYKSLMKEGDALWWIDDSAEELQAVSPIIKKFSSLDKDTKNLIQSELFAIFPEVFSNSNKKYENIPAYIAARYGVVTANVRDIFTADGRVLVTYNRESFVAPRIIGEMCRLSTKIQQSLEERNTVDKWLEQINEYATWIDMPYSLSVLFAAATRGEVVVIKAV